MGSNAWALECYPCCMMHTGTCLLETISPFNPSRPMLEVAHTLLPPSPKVELPSMILPPNVASPQGRGKKSLGPPHNPKGIQELSGEGCGELSSGGGPFRPNEMSHGKGTDGSTLWACHPYPLEGEMARLQLVPKNPIGLPS